MATSESKTVIHFALLGNSLIAVSKFVAAGVTGSSAMLSEGIHSLVDSGNQLVLLYGLNRAKQQPDDKHPFGYGMELYFWTFVVAILIFAVGSGLSIYKGIAHILEPEVISQPVWNYVVLGISIVFEAIAWYVAFKAFNRQRKGRPFIKEIRRSKDPVVFTVLFEDSAAILGLVLALGGVAGSHLLGIPELDGLASIGIGVILAAVAVLLAMESKGLLIGEGADPVVIAAVEAIVKRNPMIECVNEILTMHFGPSEVLLNASIDFIDGLTVEQVETAISELEQTIKDEHPEIRRVFLEVQSWRGHADDKRRGQAQFDEGKRDDSQGAIHDNQ